jgi:hypothetical protein
MSDRIPEPGNAGDQRGSEPDMSDTAEFAKMRAVMRASEKHREGGVDPELEDPDADPTPEPGSGAAGGRRSSLRLSSEGRNRPCPRHYAECRIMPS